MLPYEHPDKIARLYQQSGESGLAARQLAEAGNYTAASNILHDNETARIVRSADSAILQSYRWVDADSMILAKAAMHDLVMFNEDHNTPHARAMLLDLLPDLRAMGYEYLALEALGTISGRYAYDSLIHERGYPIAHSGIYTREATFSLLVRAASRLGFTIIGYDDGSGSERETMGARNIIEQITHHGITAKTIILCGWDHIREGPTHTYWEYALAERLRQMTGIDPLTVASTTFVHMGKEADNHPVVSHMPSQSRFILVDVDADTTYSEQLHPYYDLEVVQPYVKHILPWQRYDDEYLSSSLLPDSLGQQAMLYLYAATDDIKMAVPIYRTAIVEPSTYYPRMSADMRIVVTDGSKSYELSSDSRK